MTRLKTLFFFFVITCLWLCQMRTMSSDVFCFFFFLTHHLPWNLRLCLEFMDTSILSSEVVRYIFETVAVVSSLLNLLPSIYSFNCSWLHFCKVDLIVANYKIFVVNARRCVGKKRSLTFRTWTFRGPFVGHNN